MEVAPENVLGIAIDQTAKVCIAFDNRRLDPLAGQKSVRLERYDGELENLLANLRIESLPDRAQFVLRGRVFLVAVAEKRSDREAVRTPRGDRPLTAQIFKEAYDEHLEIHHRIELKSCLGVTRPRDRFAQFPNAPLEAHRGQASAKFGVEPFALTLWEHTTI